VLSALAVAALPLLDGLVGLGLPLLLVLVALGAVFDGWAPPRARRCGRAWRAARARRAGRIGGRSLLGLLALGRPSRDAPGVIPTPITGVRARDARSQRP